MRPRLLLALTAVVVLAVTACSDDGRTMRPPSPDQTASILTSPTSSLVPIQAMEPVLVPAITLPWAPGTAIPATFTCSGEDVSPAVGWSALPEGTVEVAITMTDPDAGDFVHWVVAGLDPTVGQVAQAGVPEDATQSKNDFGSVGYRGPCPPSGTHTYFVRLYALREASNLTPGGDPRAAIERLDAVQLASASQDGTFAAS